MTGRLTARVVVCPACGCMPISRVELEDGIMTFSTCNYCGEKIRKRSG